MYEPLKAVDKKLAIVIMTIIIIFCSQTEWNLQRPFYLSFCFLQASGVQICLLIKTTFIVLKIPKSRLYPRPVKSSL